MWSATLIGVYGLLSSFEDLTNCEDTFSDASLLNWNIAQLNSKWLYKGASGRLICAVLAYPNIRILFYVRLVGSASLALAVLSGTLSPVWVWTLLVIEVALFVRHRVGQDGSRHMAVIVLLYLVVVTNIPSTRLLEIVAPGYVAAQLVVAYFFSGFGKLVSPMWRRGDAFRRIISTKDYGNSAVYEILARHPAASYIVGWVVILCELMFVGLIFVGVTLVPADYAYHIVAFGVIFHGVIAVVMGLNLFFFSFLAAYPPLVLTVQHVQALLGQ